MQKIKTIQINDTQSFTVKELNMRKIWQLQQDEKLKALPDGEKMKYLLKEACPELTTNHFFDLYPSEIKQLWDVFEEVNDDFLAFVRMLGLDKLVIEEVRKSVLTSIVQFASSSDPDTVQ